MIIHVGMQLHRGQICCIWKTFEHRNRKIIHVGMKRNDGKIWLTWKLKCNCHVYFNYFISKVKFIHCCLSKVFSFMSSESEVGSEEDDNDESVSESEMESKEDNYESTSESEVQCKEETSNSINEIITPIKVKTDISFNSMKNISPIAIKEVNNDISPIKEKNYISLIEEDQDISIGIPANEDLSVIEPANNANEDLSLIEPANKDISGIIEKKDISIIKVKQDLSGILFHYSQEVQNSQNISNIEVDENIKISNDDFYSEGTEDSLLWQQEKEAIEKALHNIYPGRDREQQYTSLCAALEKITPAYNSNFFLQS